MKIRSNWPLILLLLIAAVLGVRLAWTLTRSATGWKPHLNQWANIATSVARIERTTLSDKEPETQARFWLNEAAQVEGADDDPQVAMGAAWMLDAPQFGFVRRHVRMKEGLDFPGIPASWRRELDNEAISALTEDFESLCRDECLAKIETAIRLDSGNVELWRVHALLVFRTKFMSLDLEPRRDDWLSVLDECAKHDPDNALYDYLAALHLWSSSAEYDYEDDGYVLRVEDRATFEQGNARLAAGLAQPHLKFGTHGYAATMAFLKESSTDRSDHLTAAGSRQIDGRATNLLFRIMRWQSVQLDIEKREENFEAAIVAVRKVLRISEQVTESGNYPNLTSPKLFLRQWSLANLKDMNKDHPKLLDADEAEKVAVEFGQVQLDLKVLEEVGKRLKAEAGKDSGANRMLAIFLMVTAQMLIIATLGWAFLSGLVALVFGKTSNERVEMGWLRHSVAWLGGIGVSFVILGMCPAEIVSPGVQTWFLCGLIWIGFALVTMGLLFLVRKRFQLPWAQFAVLAASMTLPIVVAVVIIHLSATVDLGVSAIAQMHPAVTIASLLAFAWLCWKSIRLILAFAQTDVLTRRRKFFACGVLFLLALITIPAGIALSATISDELEVKAWISPTVWKEAEALQITPAELQSEMQLADSKWVWAFIQWLAHHGAFVAPLIAVGILLIWHLIRRARRFEGGCREMLRSQKRSQIRQAGNVVARSCVVASLVFSLVYLGSTPIVADSMETYYRVHHERLVNPSHTWNEIEVATSQIKSDESLMMKLKAEIAERNRQIAEQEKWRDE
jgi:hypothetical protein